MKRLLLSASVLMTLLMVALHAQDVAGTWQGTLQIQGRRLRLAGVEATGAGRSVRDFRNYLRGREVACEPVGAGDEYQCRVDNQDLSRVVLFNGGSRAAANASAEHRRMEELARSMRAGIWGRRDDDEED